MDILGVVDLGAHFPGRLAYHPSCHLSRDLGVTRQPRMLLEAVRGAEFVELPSAEDCCGFGGIFSIEHPEVSAAMLERKIGNLNASGAPLLVACDSGCLAHISGGLHRRGAPQRAVHIAEVLAEE
jgi:L-lactate dehydrogenase complex protein LldE